MDKKKVEIIVTSGLVLVLVLAWAGSISRIKKASPLKPAAQAPVAPATQSTPASGIPQASNQQVEEEINWARDPFSGKLYAKITVESRSDLHLAGIMWDNESPAAVVNDRVVEVGDRINDYTVIKINPESVVLREGLREVEIRMVR